jgi:phosphate starvation-inducible PhoH-like protein
LKGAEPREVFGANDHYFKRLKGHFPKLRLIARGEEVKAIGERAEIDRFEEALQRIVKHVQRYRELSDSTVDALAAANGSAIRDAMEKAHGDEPGVLVHGNDGLRVKARTKNQEKLVKAVEDNDMVFAIGPAGTGKTYTAVALAVRALKNREVRRIILTRPAVEAGESLGFLPGDLKEKLDPYLQPLYDGLRDMIPASKLADWLENGTIQIAPLAFMRGRTLDHAFVILDEAQNATLPQLKMFLTRMGRDAKFVITGDTTQVDLPARQRSGLQPTLQGLKEVEGISIVKLNERDVIRHELVTKVIGAFKKIESKKNEPTDDRKH